MKWIIPTLALSVFGFGFASSELNQHSGEVTVIISGGARGHLSPCGCTKPMSGGFKRLATIVRGMKSKGKVVWVDTGDIIDTPSRQSQLKVETYGELLGRLGVDAVAYTSQDLRQGAGLIAAAGPLSKKLWLVPDSAQTGITSDESNILGITVSASNEQAISFGGERATDILLFDGPKKALEAVSKPHQIEVFASEGIPTIVGKRLSPGSNLRGVIVATFRDRRLYSAKVVALEASIKEDAVAEKIYRNYLLRVTQERLIDTVSKDTNDDFVGSKNCKSCHGKVYDQFAKTKHADAYLSLVKQGHHADPDCVSCHVVGLNSTKGFFYEKTPGLAQVGCESCHGAGRNHARSPKQFRLPKVGEEKCLTCHTPSNSPNFIFKSFWKKIKHR